MLPDIRTNPERESIQQAKKQESKEKARLKMYNGGKSNVRHQNIKEGETILLERKITNANSQFDPQPFTAEAVHGTQIVGRRGEESGAQTATVVQQGTAGRCGGPRHKPPSHLQCRD